jgi:CHAT domain-containing protein/Tfp pilus assembly protein PilF
MLQRNALRRSFRRIVGAGIGLFIVLLIGSSLIRTAHTAQLKVLRTLSAQQDKAGAGAAPGGAATLAIDPGSSIEREISSGRTQAYQIMLEAGKYLRIQVEQRGIDVTLALLAPDGKTVAESRSDNGNFGPETVSMIAERRVEVRLEVRSPDWEAPSGRYELKIADLRMATEEDRKRVEAERALAEGERLLKQETAESLSQSLAKYEAALQLYRSAGDRGGEAASSDKICQVYYLTSKAQKARDTCNQSLQLYQSLGDRSGEAVALNNIGGIYFQISERRKALDHFERALPISREAGNRMAESLTLYNLGRFYLVQGEKQKAIAYYDQALRLAQIAGPRLGEGSILNDIALIYNSIGEKQKALDYYQQSLLIRRDVRDRRGEAITLNNLGRLYDTVGEMEKALDYYNRSLIIRREVYDREGEAVTLSNIGLIYIKLGENQRALETLNQSLVIRRDVRDRSGESATLNNIGGVYKRLGDKQKALDYYEQALQIRRALNDRSGQAITLHNIGSIRLSVGEREAALETFDQSLRLSRTVGAQENEANTLKGMAQAERDRGNLTEALGKIEAAIKIVESVRTRIGEGELRASYLGATQGYYEFYIDLLMRLHRLDPSKDYAVAAFQTSERSRARALIETLAEARAEIRSGIDPALLASERTLRQRLESKNDRLIRLLGGKYTEEQAAAARSEIESLEIEYQQLQSQIRAASPRYGALTQPQPLSLAEIQQQVMDDNALLLEYALGEERSYLWAATKTSITSQELPPRNEIEQAANHVRDLLTARNRVVRFETADERQARVAQADAKYPKAAAALSQMLLGPIAGKLEKKRLLIVADGALQYVPFAALPKPVVSGRWLVAGGKATTNRRPLSTNRRPPLVVDHEVVSLPSASALAVLRRELAGRKPAPKTVAVLADPVFDPGDERFKASVISRGTEREAVAQSRTASAALESDLNRSARDLDLSDARGGLRRLPFTRKEAQTILSLAPPDQRFVALDFAANQTTATSDELAQYRYVHFATHGLLNPKHPELSGIVLSLFNEQGAEQDGFLRASEVYNLNLPAELVVLSGCQTALGKDVRGEGLIGLTRGFMYAGAARALVSLWEVNDHATSELMGRLYRGMLGKRRLSPAVALREAQLSLWREKRWSAPYYWAGFTLQGELR